MAVSLIECIFLTFHRKLSPTLLTSRSVRVVLLVCAHSIDVDARFATFLDSLEKVLNNFSWWPLMRKSNPTSFVSSIARYSSERHFAYELPLGKIYLRGARR